MTVDVTLSLGERLEGGPQDGAAVTLPLSKAPHVLVAGMTGAGKSVYMHSLITQMIELPARDLGLLLIDPKRVELAAYEGLPHLPFPPVFEPEHITFVLQWAVREMDRRFNVMRERNTRDVATMPWPRLVVVVDELANLVLTSKAYEPLIVKIASMGRAAGVHLLLATQRPDSTVLSGLLRANVNTRVCLPVQTASDSRIVLDDVGGDKLAGAGHALVRFPGQRDLIAVTTPYISDQALDAAVDAAVAREMANAYQANVR